MIRTKVEKFFLLFVGSLLGVLLSSAYSVSANKKVEPSLPVKELREFSDIFGKIKSDYVDSVEDKKLITSAINGMVSGLDPHSSYLDADSFKSLQIGTQGEFGGLGIEVGSEDGLVKVISAIDDTPAFKLGIKSGDLIVKLDDTPVKTLTLNEAVNRMRGVPGTKITLTIMRKNEPAPLQFTITRAVIKVQSIKAKLADPNYGYVRISQFQERTGEDLAKALSGLYDKNKTPLKGMILDLRNNPGGLLNSAVAVSATFLPKDTLVVYTKGRNKRSQMRLSTNPDDYLSGNQDKDYLQKLPTGIKTVPLMVLVNDGSASASEIVAGALQDHKRATVLGTTTFGKGSVQTILPLSDNTGIKLTTSRYFTPNGRSIQAKGITPDVVISDQEGSNALSFHEADLANHLSNPENAKTPGNVSPDSKTPGNTEDKKPAVSKAPAKPFVLGSAEDVQYNEALRLLKGGAPATKPSTKSAP